MLFNQSSKSYNIPPDFPDSEPIIKYKILYIIAIMQKILSKLLSKNFKKFFYISIFHFAHLFINVIKHSNI